jgi:hypothetical protein
MNEFVGAKLVEAVDLIMVAAVHRLEQTEERRYR